VEVDHQRFASPYHSVYNGKSFRLFPTRIWKKFELSQSKNDGVKRIDGSAAL
jgi:hypothetical protein